MKNTKKPARRTSEVGLSFATLAIHAGQEPDPVTGSIVTPIHLTSTFVQEAPAQHKGYEYSRTLNPTRKALEENVAALEKGHYAAAFASGMAAISTLIQIHDAGCHVISSQNVYGGTFRLFDKVFQRHGFEFSFVDTRDVTQVERALRKNTKLIFIETPTNPMMQIADIGAICRLAHPSKIKVAVDNTFLSPYFQRPIEKGADFVIHSATKYLGGHSDLVGGILVTKDPEDTQRVRFVQNSAGAVLSPFDSWLLLRGIKTLPIRMEAHEKNALSVAKFLEGHKKVESVIYPGLPSHPQHRLQKSQAQGNGGLLSFELKRGKDPVRFLKGLKICSLAESLGAVETLISVPALMTHASVPPERRKELGITDTLIRISVGIEDEKDLIADLSAALRRA